MPVPLWVREGMLSFTGFKGLLSDVIKLSFRPLMSLINTLSFSPLWESGTLSKSPLEIVRASESDDRLALDANIPSSSAALPTHSSFCDDMKPLNTSNRIREIRCRTDTWNSPTAEDVLDRISCRQARAFCSNKEAFFRISIFRGSLDGR